MGKMGVGGLFGPGGRLYRDIFIGEHIPLF